MASVRLHWRPMPAPAHTPPAVYTRTTACRPSPYPPHPPTRRARPAGWDEGRRRRIRAAPRARPADRPPEPIEAPTAAAAGNQSGLPAGVGISAAARTKRADAGPGRAGRSRIRCRPTLAGLCRPTGELGGGCCQVGRSGRAGPGRKEWCGPGRGLAHDATVPRPPLGARDTGGEGGE